MSTGTRKRKRQRTSKKTTTVALYRAPKKNALVPDTMNVKLQYCQRVLLTNSGQLSIHNTWSANSLFDPDLTGIGAQYVGFDEYSSLYNRYRVYSSHFDVTCVSLGETPITSTYEAVVFPSMEAVGVNVDPEEHMGNPRSIFKVSGNQSINPMRITNYLNIGKLYGKNKVQLEAENDFSAATNANPVQQVWWNLAVQPADHSTSMTVYAYVTLTAWARFEQPKVLIKS